MLYIHVCVCVCVCEKKIICFNLFNEFNFKSIKSGTLVIFDVDETLIQPVDTYLMNEYTSDAKKLKKGLFQRYPEVKDWNDLASIMLLEAHRPLLEPMIIQKIQELKRRNIIVIACTGINIGSLGRVHSLEEWRYTQLKSLGFEGSYGNLVLKLSGFKRNPGFYRGVLSTDLELKGPVIGEFLDQIGLRPQKIVMFDDNLDFLKSVKKECKKRGIIFDGYKYKGFKSKTWDEALIQFQADYLIRNKKWINDKEARAKMDK